jgi:hypothetical protein
MNHLYPRKLGIIKPNGNLEKIELKNQLLGDQYMGALSAGSNKVPEIKSLILSNNRLT